MDVMRLATLLVHENAVAYQEDAELDFASDHRQSLFAGA
jgi:hypothetical protein